jgi:hypothetical protein
MEPVKNCSRDRFSRRVIVSLGSPARHSDALGLPNSRPQRGGARGTPRTCRSSRSRLRKRTDESCHHEYRFVPASRARCLRLAPRIPRRSYQLSSAAGQRGRSAILPSRDAPSREAQWRTALRAGNTRLGPPGRACVAHPGHRRPAPPYRTPLEDAPPTSEVDRNISLIIIIVNMIFKLNQIN